MSRLRQSTKEKTKEVELFGQLAETQIKLICNLLRKSKPPSRRSSAQGFAIAGQYTASRSSINSNGGVDIFVQCRALLFLSVVAMEVKDMDVPVGGQSNGTILGRYPRNMGL